MAIEIVDLPNIEHVDFPVRYFSLPVDISGQIIVTSL